MPDRDVLHVFSPVLDQSVAVARLLRRAQPERRLVGVRLPDEPRPLYRRPFDKTVDLLQADLKPEAACVPTGGLSTALMLEKGDIRLGDVVMNQDALRFYDKVWSLELADDAGVPTPRTWTRAEDIKRYPVFYKPDREGGGETRGVAHGPQDLPPDEEALIFQELITGRGTHGVAFIASAGVLRVAHIHHEIESYPETGGSAVVIESVESDALVEYTRAMVERSKFSGWGLAEYKYCPVRDDFFFMEVNAKFWATSEFAFRNAPEFTRILFDTPPLDAPCRRSIYMHRAFARGPAGLTRLMKDYGRASELRFTPGKWEIGLGQFLLPKAVRRRLRRVQD